MKILKNIILFFKNLLKRQKDVKLLEAPKQVVRIDSKSDFIQTLKITITENKIETLICNGNGLGIQKKISY